jgi:hypothetical protein
LDFLGPCLLATKTLVYEGWKSLDFLGFSRANRAFSMSYTGFSLKEISRALNRGGGSAEWSVRAFTVQKLRIVHGASLT